MADVTTLPISPQNFWIIAGVIGIGASTAAIYWALSRMGRDHRPPVWEELREGWGGPIIFLGLLWLGLFALTIAAAYVGVWQAVHPKGETGQPNLGLGALLAALLGAPFVIWGTWLKYQTVRYQKEGHITDRINKAVEMLGSEKVVKKQLINSAGKKVYEKDEQGEPDFSKPVIVEISEPNIEVRIGAILSLERIAQDSTIHDKGRDHVRVMEILCAYVRENAPAKSARRSTRELYEEMRQDSVDGQGLSDQQIAEKRGQEFMDMARDIDHLRYWAKALPKPRVDVAQALAVIGRRTAEQRRVEAAWPNPPTAATQWPFDTPCPRLQDEQDAATPSHAEFDVYRERLRAWHETLIAYQGYRPNLGGVNLQGADLSAKRPDASDAIFSGVIFEGARMEGAKLELAQLQRADLGQARLDGANLWHAQMEGANLALARLEGAGLGLARLERANLWQARMEGAILGSARLDAANLGRARMEKVDLSRARMEGANLWLAQMDGADLGKAHFDAATNWAEALLQRASVRFVDLSTTPISTDQVKSAFGDGSTILPQGMPRPTHWPEAELGLNEFQDEWEKWRADPARYRPPKSTGTEV